MSAIDEVSGNGHLKLKEEKTEQKLLSRQTFSNAKLNRQKLGQCKNELDLPFKILFFKHSYCSNKPLKVKNRSKFK